MRIGLPAIKTLSVWNTCARAQITLRKSSFLRRFFLTGSSAMKVFRHRVTHKTAFDDTLCSPPDPKTHFVVTEFDPFGKIKRRRITKPNHLMVTTDELQREFGHRQRQKMLPFLHERPPFELNSLARMHDLRFINQARVATKLPRNKPMQDQLRSVTDDALVDLDIHNLKITPSIAKRKHIRRQHGLKSANSAGNHAKTWF
jgi:hypothetical protein